MADTALTLDFSTVFVPSVTDTAIAALASQGFSNAIIGLDSTPGSRAVRQAFVDQQFRTSAYRFLYQGSPDPQIADVLAAIHLAPMPLPDYLVLDIEPTWNADGTVKAPPPPRASVSRAMDLVEAADVRPSGSLVKPVIYTAKYVFDTYYPGWTEPADRGWLLWGAFWNKVRDLLLPLFAGWQQEQVVAHQFTGTIASPIGDIDQSMCLVPSAQPQPVPEPTPQPADPASALNRIIRGRQLLADADAEFQAAQEDITI